MEGVVKLVLLDAPAQSLFDPIITELSLLGGTFLLDNSNFSNGVKYASWYLLPVALVSLSEADIVSSPFYITTDLNCGKPSLPLFLPVRSPGLVVRSWLCSLLVIQAWASDLVFFVSLSAMWGIIISTWVGSCEVERRGHCEASSMV